MELKSATETLLVAFHPTHPEMKIVIREYQVWDREVFMDRIANRYGRTYTLIQIVNEQECADLVAAGAVRVL